MHSRYDIVVLGGAFAGSTFSLLLRRRRPEARLLIVEPRTTFDRKVGEATVEISAHFLDTVLGLREVLERDHLAKHGLRFWFTDGPDRDLGSMTEIGPDEVPALPSFQLDRERLDPELLRLAEEEGAEVARGYRAKSVDRRDDGFELRLEGDGPDRRVEATWLIDATGRHGFLARRWNLRRKVEAPRTTAVWARWRDVADLDDRERFPELSHVAPRRRLATNHFCGHGWWCWKIPLQHERASVGLVWDKTIFDLPGRGPLLDRYVDFVRGRPGLGQLLEEAKVEREDHMAYGHLPYAASRYAGRRWALLGDAASFTDPFYSPGLDHTAMSVYATAQLVDKALGRSVDGAAEPEAVAEHNARFLRSYGRWLEALYTDKYELFGDAQLTAASYLADTALYYLGVVRPVLRDRDALAHPTFGLGIPATRWASASMARFKRRLVTLARRRRELGLHQRRNAGWRLYSPAFRAGAGSLRHLGIALRLWWGAEWSCLIARAKRRLRRDRIAGEPEPAG